MFLRFNSRILKHEIHGTLIKTNAAWRDGAVGRCQIVGRMALIVFIETALEKIYI